MKGRAMKERGEPNGRFPNVRRLSNKEITQFMEHILRMRHTPPDRRGMQKVPL